MRQNKALSRSRFKVFDRLFFRSSKTAPELFKGLLSIFRVWIYAESLFKRPNRFFGFIAV